MDTSRKWIVTRLDGRIASVSTSFRSAAAVLGQLSPSGAEEVRCEKMDTAALFDLADSTRWEDLRLFGSPFQLSVWRKLFYLTHFDSSELGPAETPSPHLVSYSDLADSLGKSSGVRAVAHAVGLNPCNVIIPCHLVIPKESLERLRESEDANGLFKWETLYMVDRHIDYGEYSLGPSLKRELIREHLKR